ncbi:MAG: hypothetical protein WCW66_00305 [Patescibacteria group bacterium]
MNLQKRENDLRKEITKRLKRSNKKLWQKLSANQQNAVVEKYIAAFDIENIGLQNALNNIKQDRQTLVSVTFGFALGITGSLLLNALNEVIHSMNWYVTISLFIVLFLVLYFDRLIKKSNVEELSEYKVLEYLLAQSEKDEKKDC